MIAVIRIAGEIGLDRDVKETLSRLRLKRKYACVVFEKPNEVQIGMINKVRDFSAFGEINKETYDELKKKRGRKDKKGNLKPFFRLHPPRGGIKSKIHFPKGVLGNHGDKINELILRML